MTDALDEFKGPYRVEKSPYNTTPDRWAVVDGRDETVGVLFSERHAARVATRLNERDALRERVERLEKALEELPCEDWDALHDLIPKLNPHDPGDVLLARTLPVLFAALDVWRA